MVGYSQRIQNSRETGASVKRLRRCVPVQHTTIYSSRAIVGATMIGLFAIALPIALLITFAARCCNLV
jgi:hypothetical protein